MPATRTSSARPSTAHAESDEGPVQLELAKAVEQLPGEHGMSGGARYELTWDGFIH